MITFFISAKRVTANDCVRNPSLKNVYFFSRIQDQQLFVCEPFVLTYDNDILMTHSKSTEVFIGKEIRDIQFYF